MDFLSLTKWKLHKNSENSDMSSAVSCPTSPSTPPAPTAIISPPRSRVTGDRCLAAPFPDAVTFLWPLGSLQPLQSRCLEDHGSAGGGVARRERQRRPADSRCSQTL